MARRLGAVLLVAMAGGCTTTKLMQKDGCWVKHSERFLGSTSEEVGPCARPTSPWVEDRLTRLVQECMAREDYRWQGRALAAFSRGEPMPPQASEKSVLQQCMNDAASANIGERDALKQETEALRQRVADLSTDRDSMRARADDDRQHLLATQDKLAEYLGEAAKKAQQPAVATASATSDGYATTEHTSSSSTPQAAPVALAVSPATAAPPAPAAAPVKAAAAPAAKAVPACAPESKPAVARHVRAKARPARARLPACEPAPAEVTEAAAPADGATAKHEAGAVPDAEGN